MNSHILNMPTELVLGDTKFLMSALTDLDEAELDEYVQAKLIDNARKSLPKNASDAEWDRTMAIAMRTSLSVSWSRPPGSKIFLTTMGLARLAWQGIKRNDKNITVEQIHALLFDPRNVAEVHRQFKKVNAPPDVLINTKGGEADAQSFPKQMST